MLLLAAIASADDVRFDLAGPKFDITVTRNGITLPIAQVPNLLPQDQLQIKADLPSTQSNHLLLIVAFLRGTTNEPPDGWFTAVETWKPEGQHSVRLTVPDGAQRVVLFVAPETGGDFDTLRSVVKRNPGVFLRASDSLFKGSLQQQRIERYLSGMQSVAGEDEKVVAARSAKLAGALILKPNADCFKQPVEDQVDCLTQASAPMLLDSGGAQTISAAFSTGASSDFINEASQNDGGVYSAYVGTIVDLVHLAGLLHTAQYRYIPALTLPDGSTLNTRLNAPPSFSNPKSVIVIALPPIKPSRVPDLHLEDDHEVFCLKDPGLVLPLRGSATLYSTAFAHDLVLDFGDVAQHRTVPLTSDVVAGGLLLDRSDLSLPNDGTGDAPRVQAIVRGKWGFDRFEGPSLTFQQVEGSGWRLIGTGSITAGSKAQVQLQGNSTACLSRIMLAQPGADAEAISFPRGADDSPMMLTLPFVGKGPGIYALMLLQYGSDATITLPLRAYAETNARITSAYISPDQQTITLSGAAAATARLVKVGDAVFTPVGSQALGSDAEFRLQSAMPVHSGENALVADKDGRTTTVALIVDDSVATLHVISFTSEPENVAAELPVELLTEKAVPLHSTLHFVVKSEGSFLASDHMEIATAEGAAKELSFGPGNTGLVLEDERTVVGTLDADKVFGESAFGMLNLRLVRANGERGPWVPLGTLVRRPEVTAIRCISKSCVVRGRNLFLIRELSTSEDFANPIQIPENTTGEEFRFLGDAGQVRALYLHLRDGVTITAVVRVQAR